MTPDEVKGGHRVTDFLTYNCLAVGEPPPLPPLCSAPNAPPQSWGGGELSIPFASRRRIRTSTATAYGASGPVPTATSTCPSPPWSGCVTRALADPPRVSLGCPPHLSVGQREGQWGSVSPPPPETPHFGGCDVGEERKRSRVASIFFLPIPLFFFFFLSSTFSPPPPPPSPSTSSPPRRNVGKLLQNLRPAPILPLRPLPTGFHLHPHRNPPAQETTSVMGAGGEKKKTPKLTGTLSPERRDAVPNPLGQPGDPRKWGKNPPSPPYTAASVAFG